MDKDNICFVIAPIGEQTSETRKRSDQVLKHVIKPATDQCGYKAIRADEISEPGMITSQVIQHVVEDPLMIADLTERNPNVFYELAIRHAIKKPMVQIIRKGDQIPFDVAGMRTIPVDHHDLDSVEESRKEIVAQIKAIEKKKPDQIESPISVSLELKHLRESDKPEARTLADVLSSITELRTGVSNLEKKLNSPETILPPGYLRAIQRDIVPHRLRPTDRLLMEVRALLAQWRDTKFDEKKKKDFDQIRDQLERIMYILQRESGLNPDSLIFEEAARADR